MRTPLGTFQKRNQLVSILVVSVNANHCLALHCENFHRPTQVTTLLPGDSKDNVDLAASPFVLDDSPPVPILTVHKDYVHLGKEEELEPSMEDAKDLDETNKQDVQNDHEDESDKESILSGSFHDDEVSTVDLAVELEKKNKNLFSLPSLPSAELSCLSV
jgi:hypothetical protein